jgi:hypothetical protein
VPGGGLYFCVVGDDTLYWVYRYQGADGKRHAMSLGTYPALGLADARIKHAEKRARVLAGADPPREKRAGKEARTTVPAFGQAADDYIPRTSGRGKPPRIAPSGR